MDNVISVILGGGRGTRLYPLTKERSKPAVPLAGKYRLIDIPISNCLNSDLNKIYVLTQFNSASLHRHITRAYKFDNFSRGFIEILAATQTVESMNWYQGTADAVRQNLRFFNQPNIDFVLILSGDQLYRMNYEQLIKEHIRTGAEVTISVIPAERKDAPHLGILKIDEQSRIIDFFEKPKDGKVIDSFSLDASSFDRHGVSARGRTLLASMGIYIFNLEVLREVLKETNKTDFGKEIIPEIIKKRRVFAYFFDGYWEDIGTIKSFYEANLKMTSLTPSFDLFNEKAPIYTNPLFLPGSIINDSKITQSIIADGCIINKAEIHNSVIGIRSVIGKNVVIQDSIVMGADYYESEPNIRANRFKKIPDVGIGDNSRIRGAIIDKNVHIGENVTIENVKKLEQLDAENYMIRDYIVIIPKDSVIPSHTVI
ncbi:MAG: glucose-1-phosphate adenylyltransferase [Candidatus Brocadia sp. AMX2]|uniref:Glucose-1-phosphate adenylyltransferase n=1 Tax=Candidatus Brocadia sinica JPN1 TaxID=1197129 RepID=A0ABQ0JY20_9BACT|nr:MULTISPECIES: glucose-1-phosphate adenylyltransferase [Brocadia]MBC6931422.1 glucose-1-phosphate adenylyltransferase [Candidatus Brocadia sp.]MBL1167522.1 glucose-1-phosphate adenylyltransferase [Candidatus Brocadia sp. AMX1]NOG40589.1 glucose-1-phosphate adenylyltransferase [Planctomycetota bacterium]GIK13439.1 MAG: glucose-1-phosphate adenylyltransferase [Candidatus Brocadia sinica]KAA0244152.1 MAG: glucose-1-phosphate adenylyltransferase [Candidatus Brocadia sp. AMX2]